MQLRSGGGVAMTILAGDSLLDIIVADLPTFITGGEAWWHNNPNPDVRQFIKYVYETDIQDYPVFSIEPLDHHLWSTYEAIRR